MSSSDEFKIRVIQLLGFIAILIAVGLILIIPPQMAGLVTILTGAIGWYVGKLTGEPMKAVVKHAALSLPPDDAKEVVHMLSIPPASSNRAIKFNWSEDDEPTSPERPSTKPFHHPPAEAPQKHGKHRK